MAAKKKTEKKHTKSKRIAGNKVKPMKKTAKKKLVMKRAVPGKKLAKKKAAVKSKAVGNKTIGSKMGAFSQERAGARSGQQSGDLQGLSRVGRADSESVGELIEEGNAFEADVVTGVEDAGNADEKEVRTHEVPEDDVPGEYLDKE
jgi:uncharacterized protein YbjQ (UPF0145 family)